MGQGQLSLPGLNHGAIYGKAYGIQGNSFAIPTKSEILEALPINKVKGFVDRFIQYAKDHPEMTFELTPIGCGLAGYDPKEIAPLFENAPSNIELPEEFK